MSTLRAARICGNTERMIRCRCCGTTRDPETVARAGKCFYCARNARVGGCLGVHGEALRWHLDQQVADGFWTEPLAEWWMKLDRERLRRPWE